MWRFLRILKWHLSKGLALPRLWQSSCRRPACCCTSSRRQPVAPGLGNAPLPHLSAAQRPRPWHLWCSPPWAEWQSQRLWSSMFVGQIEADGAIQPHSHNTMKLTFCASSIELLHGVVKTYPDWGEAHLPLESCHQSIVKTPGPLCAHHGGDGAKHSPILHVDATFTFLRLSLNLDKRMTLKDC